MHFSWSSNANNHPFWRFQLFVVGWVLPARVAASLHFIGSGLVGQATVVLLVYGRLVIGV
jgi:hypothetical protein